MVLFDVFAPQPSQRSRPRFTPKEKELHYKAQGGKCNGCGKKYASKDLAVDHIKAFSKGGGERGYNLQLLCHSCNSIKGNGTQAQLTKRLTAKGHIKGAATTVKTKTVAAKKPTRKPTKKKAATRTRQPARPMTTFDMIDGLLDGLSR